jgi:hydroxyacyl-ACP dehydratase HTD2-like protein with hotdog domain
MERRSFTAKCVVMAAYSVLGPSYHNTRMIHMDVQYAKAAWQQLMCSVIMAA